MGNKITRRRPAIDDRHTRLQGLYPSRDVDQRKLRRLILDSKLAPCYPGGEEPAVELEECPICFLVGTISLSPFFSAKTVFSKATGKTIRLASYTQRAVKATHRRILRYCSLTVEANFGGSDGVLLLGHEQHYPSLNRSKCCTKGICTGTLYSMSPIPSHLLLMQPALVL